MFGSLLHTGSRGLSSFNETTYSNGDHDHCLCKIVRSIQSLPTTRGHDFIAVVITVQSGSRRDPPVLKVIPSAEEPGSSAKCSDLHAGNQLWTTPVLPAREWERGWCLVTAAPEVILKVDQLCLFAKGKVSKLRSQVCGFPRGFNAFRLLSRFCNNTGVAINACEPLV